MPTYLCHGFRWHRPSIRVYVVVQDLDDASPDCLTTPTSSHCLLDSFYRIFDFLPACSPPSSQPPFSSSGPATNCSLTPQSWSTVKLLEEYDPADLSAVSRPYAYVADYAVRIDLSASISDHISAYETLISQNTPSYFNTLQDPPVSSSSKKTGWFERIRDQLQRSEEIKWYIVVNGDEVRDFSSSTSRDDEDDEDDEKRSIITAKATTQQNPITNQYNLTLQQLLFAENNQGGGVILPSSTSTSNNTPQPPGKEHHHHQSQSQSSLGTTIREAGGPSSSTSTINLSNSNGSAVAGGGGGGGGGGTSSKEKQRQTLDQHQQQQLPEENSNNKRRNGLKRLFGRGRSSVAGSDG
ncbi:hypothetical protein QBC35DRAFT_9030 [Podospora australis]|uniref:Uncharacterized protein n=1 Tax=Podospora australis TaxID=1536484 RepID=A0AAN6X4R4_9PEZI|nr:hypothetical protein QBC35DRAFT_9030 [Podospora australis]